MMIARMVDCICRLDGGRCEQSVAIAATSRHPAVVVPSSPPTCWCKLNLDLVASSSFVVHRCSCPEDFFIFYLRPIWPAYRTEAEIDLAHRLLVLPPPNSFSVYVVPFLMTPAQTSVLRQLDLITISHQMDLRPYISHCTVRTTIWWKELCEKLSH